MNSFKDFLKGRLKKAAFEQEAILIEELYAMKETA